MERHEIRTRWKEYALTQSAELREALIRDYAVLARRAVERLQISPWGCVDREDLLGHAILGLIDAVDRYDPDHGVPFEAFAMPRIRGAVLDALRKLDWVPRSVRTDETSLKRAYGSLEALLGRPATDSEVATQLGVSVEEVERRVTNVARGSVLSLDDMVATMDGSTTLGDLTPGPDTHQPYRSRERADAKDRLVDAIRTLPEREQLLVSLYYYHELTLKEIGRVMNVTEQRVSQLHARAMLRLSHKLIRHRELMTVLAA